MPTRTSHYVGKNLIVAKSDIRHESAICIPKKGVISEPLMGPIDEGADIALRELRIEPTQLLVHFSFRHRSGRDDIKNRE